MKVYVSHFALAEGIEGIEEREAESCGDGMVQISTGLYLHKGQWHETRAAAIEKAEQMRVKKIASLKKTIARLEALKFHD